MTLVTRARALKMEIADPLHERRRRGIESKLCFTLAAGVALSPSARCSRPTHVFPQATTNLVADWPRVLSGVLLRVTCSNTQQRALETPDTLG